MVETRGKLGTASRRKSSAKRTPVSLAVEEVVTIFPIRHPSTCGGDGFELVWYGAAGLEARKCTVSKTKGAEGASAGRQVLGSQGSNGRTQTVLG
mmetsp:Transcript_27858/g.73603  ORF Transcript_27858/g.73603 Transcript_27858/m.73603 type:complete len:95 (-) Transcript_27858:107-391(-)